MVKKGKWGEAGMTMHAHNPSYSGDQGRRNVVQGQPGQKYKTLSENKLKLKGLGGMAQGVEHLHSKFKTPYQYRQKLEREREREMARSFELENSLKMTVL
jgi:hypothetical protein